MGGGDLNSKKSWHPNTIKNQERVWKAERAAAQEKQRIVELQRERVAEHDRAELNQLARQNVPSNDDRLSWMYCKPDKKVQHEDYLLGKTIDANFDKPDKTEDAIPAVSRRVVGSSMISSGGDTQVDLVRKMREDPLLLVKERERAARAALLNNPLQRKRLTEMLRVEQVDLVRKMREDPLLLVKERGRGARAALLNNPLQRKRFTEMLRVEQEQRKEQKARSSKKHGLDDKLAAKLNALGGKKGLDLAALLASGDSSDSSSSDEKSKKKNKKKSKKKSNKSDHDSSDDHQNRNKKSESKREHDFKYRNRERSSSSEEVVKRKRDKREYVEDRSRLIDDRKYDQRDEAPRGYWDNQRNKEDSSRDEDYSRRDRNDRDQPRKNRERSRERDQKYRDYSSKHAERSRRDCSSKKDKDRDSSHNDRGSLQNERDGRDRQKDKYDKSYRDKAEASDNRHDAKRGTEEQSRAAKPHGTFIEDTSRAAKPRGGLTSAEKAARLAEMAAAGAAHERARGERVAAGAARGEEVVGGPRMTQNALPTSLQARIQSKRHHIQRNERHMNEHFARR